MKKKKISEPVYLNLSEELKRWKSGFNIKNQSSDEEKKKNNDEKNDYTIQITFLKKGDDLG